MSCEHLICAHCTHPVDEGRCPVCRAARDEMHRRGPGVSPLLIGAALLLLISLLVAAHVLG